MTATLVLGPVLRHVARTSATIWVETSAPCEVEILDTRTRTFTVSGHHYALVVVDGLAPGSRTEYDVRLDGHRVWPPHASTFPPSSVRTLDGDPLRILFGSCRATAPHEPPYSLELDHDDRARGVDALRAHGLRMLRQSEEDWPDLLVLLGDQVYADDSSPGAAMRLERRRAHVDEAMLPPDGVVADFEEYCWLYHEAWTPEIERWVLSVVPSTMIFDDHDMIDDWNISDRWVHDIRSEPWWQEHIIGGLVSYWIYQHLGNLSPEDVDAEGMLADLLAMDDGTDYLRRWALESESMTPVPGGYRFSYSRDLGRTKLVVVDARNGRVLEPGDRRLLDEEEWAFVRDESLQACDHLLIATSLPALVPGGLHGLQQWNEALCAGRWGTLIGRGSERLRRELDLEDWAAFDRSFRDLCDLLADVGSGGPDRPAPTTITILSGDIHFAYVAEAHFPGRPEVTSRIRQVVSSPIRNALVTRERRVIRFGLSRLGRRIGGRLQRWAGRGPTPLEWEIEDGPLFSNNMGVLTFDGPHARLVVERARPDDEGAPLLEMVIDHDL